MDAYAIIMASNFSVCPMSPNITEDEDSVSPPRKSSDSSSVSRKISDSTSPQRKISGNSSPKRKISTASNQSGSSTDLQSPHRAVSTVTSQMMQTEIDDDEEVRGRRMDVNTLSQGVAALVSPSVSALHLSVKQYGVTAYCLYSSTVEKDSNKHKTLGNA